MESRVARRGSNLGRLSKDLFEAQLTFYPAGGGSPSQMPLSLASGQTLRLADVVAKFGLTNSVGALCLESSYAPSGLRMTSRTYDSVGAGTYGQAVTGRSGESAEGSRFVTGLAQVSGRVKPATDLLVLLVVTW